MELQTWCSGIQIKMQGGRKKWMNSILVKPRLGRARRYHISYSRMPVELDRAMKMRRI